MTEKELPLDQNESESFEEEETLSEADAIMEEYVQEISKDNFNQFRENALTLMKSEEYQDACLVWRAMIIKGEQIFGSAESFELAESYMSLGECLFYMTLENGDLIGADEKRQENIEMINQFIDDQGQFDNDGFQQQIQENILKLASDQVIAMNLQAAPENQARVKEDQDQPQLDPQFEEEKSEGKVNDIDIGIENLETAISIYRKVKESTQSDEERLQLSGQIAHCHILISECLSYIENFKDSMIELDRAQEEIMTCSGDRILRRLAEVHFLKGNTFMQMIQDDKRFIKDALAEYQKAEEKIMQKISLLPEGESSERKELEDCLGIFRQKIEDIQEEIVELDKVDIGQIKDLVKQPQE